jgi:hypothetical protein
MARPVPASTGPGFNPYCWISRCRTRSSSRLPSSRGYCKKCLLVSTQVRGFTLCAAARGGDQRRGAGLTCGDRGAGARQAAQALGIATAEAPGQDAAAAPASRGGLALTRPRRWCSPS